MPHQQNIYIYKYLVGENPAKSVECTIDVRQDSYLFNLCMI